jgi:hypothetical protein
MPLMMVLPFIDPKNIAKSWTLGKMSYSEFIAGYNVDFSRLAGFPPGRTSGYIEVASSFAENG